MRASAILGIGLGARIKQALPNYVSSIAYRAFGMKQMA
jgi:hypothetical protein